MDWIKGRLKEPSSYGAAAVVGVGTRYFTYYANINVGRNYLRNIWVRFLKKNQANKIAFLFTKR